MFEKVSPSHPDEEWRDVPGYEGKYWVSSFGRIKNRNIIMKPFRCTNGYLTACFWKNNKQTKILLHRLVALVFIPNPNGYNEINHIDEDKTNNHIENLEWCTRQYNQNYGGVREKISKANSGKVRDDAYRKNVGLRSLGRMWINNGDVEKFVKKEELNNYKNWNFGRLPRR